MHILKSKKSRARALFILTGLFILACAGCDKFQNPPFISKKKTLQVEGTIIAKVDDLPITLEQLEQEIQNYNSLVPNPEAKITSREQKVSYLNDQLIRRYLLYLEAKAQHLDEQPKAQEMMRNMEITVLAEQLFQREIGNLIVASSEVEEFYNLYYKEQSRQEEERRIREIMVNTEAEAKDILIELLKGADFSALAAQRSKAQSASNGGDLGFIKKGQRGPDFIRFDDIAFSASLDKSQISNIFKVKDGFYIIKVEAIKGGQAKPLSEAWDEINNFVLISKQQQKLKEISDKLLKTTKVVVYEDKIK